MKTNADLVIMDWGIGGLSVYNEVRKVLPKLSILYFSDSGVTPYGKMPKKDLERRLFFLIERFQNMGIRHVVIACNAASTALPSLTKKFAESGMLVTGVIDRGLELIDASGFKKISVIGGKRTIAAKSFTKPYRHTKKIKVTGRVAQPLSALIESGDLTSKKMQNCLIKILAPLKGSEALLLACTHYPAVADQIQKILPGTVLLDPAKSTANFIAKKWKWSSRPLNNPEQIFVTSGDPKKMATAAIQAFGVKIKTPLLFNETTSGV